MINSNKITQFIAIFFFIFLLSCGKGLNLPGGDARKFPKDPKKRVEKNLDEGRGFRLNDITTNRGGVFEFASSNELWRASLDTIDFMPLVSVNYSGGIIITDWYSADSGNDSIKISIRFLTNEVRSDALNIKVFNRNCKTQYNCIISEKSGNLTQELKSKILKTAAIYTEREKDKNFKPYAGKGFESPKN